MADKHDRTEQRAEIRRRVLKRGQIILPAGYSVIDCVVRDESANGARLKLSTVVGIPDAFKLRIMEADPRNCRIIWRSGDEMGIEFDRSRPL